LKHYIKRAFAATLTVIMLASLVPAPVALASEGEPIFSEPISLLDLFAPAGGDLSQEVVLTLIESTTNVPVNTGDWDYVNVFNMRMQVFISPLTTGTGAARTVVLQAPVGFAFGTTALPEGYSLSVNAGARTATLTFPNDVGGGVSASIEIPITPNAQGTVAQAVGNEIVARGKAAIANSQDPAQADYRIVFTASMRQGTTELATAQTALTPRAYQYENIFEGAPYVARDVYSGEANRPSITEMSTVQVTGDGFVGKIDRMQRFSFQNEFQLSNVVVHDPYWNLSVQYDIPADFVIKAPYDQYKLNEQSILFPQVNEGGFNALGGASQLTAGRNKMYSPLPDRWEGGYNTQGLHIYGGPGNTRFDAGVVVFGVPLWLEYRNAPPPLNGSWPIQVTATWQTRFGTHTQVMPMTINTRNYTLNDDGLPFVVAGGSHSGFDLQQGFEGDTGVVGQFLQIGTKTNASTIHEKHIGERMLWEIGDHYHIRAIRFQTASSIGDTYEPGIPLYPRLQIAYTYVPEGGGAPQTAADTTYDPETRTYAFPQVQDGGHITEIEFFLPDGLYLLNRNNHFQFYLDVRTDEGLETNINDPGTYRSTLTVSMPDCTAHPIQHKTEIPVFLRGPVDLLIGQVRGGAVDYNTANNNLRPAFALAPSFRAYPNLTGVPYALQQVVYAPVARLLFAYPTFTYAGGLPSTYVAETAKWMVYENVSIQIAHDEASARPLEMIWQVTANGGVLFENGYFEYTTLNHPQPRASNVASNGAADMDIRVLPTDVGTWFNLPMEDGDSLTSLTFKAERFKAIGNLYRRRWPYLISVPGGANQGGMFTFASRTDRTFPSDGETVPDWTEQLYPFNCTFSADGVADKHFHTDSGLEVTDVGFATDLPRSIHLFNAGGAVDAAIFSSVTNQNAAAQGSTVTVTLNSRAGLNAGTFADHKVMRNSELWMEFNADYVYAGLAANPQHLRAEMIRWETINGTTYMVIKEEAALTGGRNYAFNLFIKPNAKLGLNFLLADPSDAPLAASFRAGNGFRDFTDTMDKAYATQFPPYTYAMWSFDIGSSNAPVAEARAWVTESQARTAENFPGRQMAMIANAPITVTAASESGMRVFPGANGNMAAGTQAFREAQASNLDGFVTISAAPVGPLLSAEAILQIPSVEGNVQHSTGMAAPDFLMALRAGVTVEDAQTDSGDAIPYTITYSTNGGATYTATPGDWGAVTHVKVSLPQVPAGHGVTVRLPMRMVDDFADVPEGDRSYIAGNISYTDGTTGMERNNVFTGLAVFTPQRGAVQGGYVFLDNNGNHRYDPAGGDAKVAGATVRLFAADDLDTVLDTAITDANGFYRFTGLLAGEYVTQVVLEGSLANYSFANTGETTNPFASHVDADGFSPVITLLADRDANYQERTNAGLVKRLVLIYAKGVPASVSGMPEPLITDQLAGADVELAAAPTATGYTFIGWKCDVLSCEICAAAPYHQPFNGLEDEAANYYTMPGDSVVMTAMWTAKDVIVNFYNNHSATDDTQYAAGNNANTSKKFGDTLTTFTNPERTGYTFAGWFTARSGGTAWDFTDDTIAVEGTLNLYAQWTAKDVTVNFYNNHSATDDTQYATGNNANTGKKFSDTLSTFADPSRTGYTFAGWYTERSSGTEWSFATDTIATEGALNLYAQWTADAATVRFFNNHDAADNTRYAIGEDANADKKFGDKLDSFIDPTRTGYTFAGWYTARTDGTAWDFGSDVIATEGTLDLFAQWTADPVTVNFYNNHADTDDTQYATGNSANTGKKFGDTLTTFTDPTRTGYTFAGWFTARSGGTEWNFATDTIAVEGPLNLYAQWTAKDVAVNFYNNHSTTDDTQYATGNNANTGKKFGDTLTTFTDPTRTGYTFVGWFSARSGGTEWNFASDTISVEGTLNLYAQWTADAVTVNFFNNHNDTDNTRYDVGETANASKQFGDTLSTFADPERTGYTFAGWFSARSGGTEWNFATDTIDTVGALNLYAQWTRNTIAITYDTNGSTEHPASPFTPATGSTVAPAYGKIGESATGTPAYVNPGDPTRTGYTFAGWYTSLGAAAAKEPGTAWVFDADTVDQHEGSMTLYAGWISNTNDIVYGYTGTVPTGADAVLPTGEEDVPFGAAKAVAQSPTLYGYSFSGWDTNDVVVDGSGNFNMPNSSVTFTGSWIAKDVAIFFFNNHDATDTSRYTTGETANAGKKFGETLADFTEPQRTGYTFSGWFTERAEGTEYIPGASVIDTEGPLNLYAQWTLNSHNLTYQYTNAPAGAPTVSATENVSFGTTKTVWQPGNLTGYTFSGWTPTGTSVTSGDFTMPDNAVTFTGTWNAKEVEVRFFNNHDVTDTSRYATGENANTGKKFGETLSPFTPPTRTGYDFDGWFTERTGGTEYIPGASVIDTEGPLELYAQWSLKQIEVRFFNNHSATDTTRYATGEAANAGKLYGDALSAFADPAREQHEFIGWFTARTGGDEYVPDVSVIDTDGTLNLYAQWTSTHVTIRYRANDPAMGSTSPGSETIHKTLDTAQGSTATPQPGFLFVNWTDSQGRVVGTNRTFVPDKVAGENVEATYTANFREMDHVTIYYVAREGGSVYPSASRVNPVTGEPVRSTATPAPGYVFVNWTDAQGNVVGTGITFRPRKADHELWRDGTTFFANFAPAAERSALSVIFVDWNGTVLKHERVPYGGSATPPADPERARHTFIGWAGIYTNVTRNTYVFAQYDRAPRGDGTWMVDDAVPLAGGAVSNFGDTVD